MTRTWLEREVRKPDPNGRNSRLGDEPIHLFICRTCGKVSQAQRRPKYHQRFLPALEADGAGTPELTGVERAERLGFQVLEEVDAREIQTAVDDFDYDPGGAWVACGPFEAWTATKDEQR